MPRHTDPRLIGELKGEWSEYGCLLCGRSSPVTAPSGFGIELDHVWTRGQGGGDYRWNIIGLCGEMAGCRGHWRRTTNRISIAPTGRGLKEPPAGEWGWVLVDEDDATRELGLPAPCLEPEPVPIDGTRHDLVTIAPAAHGETQLRTETGVPIATPEERHAFIRTLWTDAEKRRIGVAVMLGWVEQSREYRRLGFDRMSDYAADAGISKGDCSKMLLVARTFKARWLEMPAHEQAELSLERLYMAARLVRDNEYTLEAGLEAAVVHPTDQLIALIKGDEPADICVCPTCNKRHIRGGSAGDLEVALDA